MSFVSLTKEECREAARAAVERRLTNLFKELNNLYSHGYACGNAWASDIEAAGAEVAFAKFINKEWIGDVNTFHAPDVDGGWQVRYTDNVKGKLIIRPIDKPKYNEKFVLVKGLMPEYEIIGYIVGLDAVKDKYCFDPNGKGKAYFVPDKDLIKFEKNENSPPEEISRVSGRYTDCFDF